MRTATLFRGLLLCSLLVIPISASAHGTGVSFEKDVDAYTVDIGYDTPSPHVGDRIVFDFDLRKAHIPVAFDSVWVRITRGDTTLLATGVSYASIGPTTLLMTLPPAPGTITIDARFESKGATLAEASFPLVVGDSSIEWSWVFLVPLGIFGVSIFIFYIFLLHRPPAV